jgi:transcription antitermination factor NusG
VVETEIIGSTHLPVSEGSDALVQATPICRLDQGERWYAAHTRGRHEKQVSRQLDEKRVDHFLPLYRSVRRWKDRRKEIELALFPGYVFVHIDLRDRLPVLQIPSVVSFVCFGGRPAALDDQDIETLQKGLANGLSTVPFPYLQAGRKVRVKGGPLAGFTGFVVRKKDKFRVVLSIDLIQRSVAVEVDACDLEWTPHTLPHPPTAAGRAVP